MSKILLGIMGAMGVSMFLYYQFAVVPMKNKIEEQTKVILAQELRDQEQKAAIESLQNNMQKTSEALKGLQVKNQKYEEDMAEYLDIFRRHNVAKLASAKPGLVELTFNKGTKEVFNAIQEDSTRISSLND
jgi:hypothetical protein|tara:strand:- start:145 stop:537 length:393 start_codon:yes stop_codon:yes gene_type:complete